MKTQHLDLNQGLGSQLCKPRSELLGARLAFLGLYLSVLVALRFRLDAWLQPRMRSGLILPQRISSGLLPRFSD